MHVGRFMKVGLGVAAFAIAASSPVSADVVTFDGSISGGGFAGPDMAGTCAPLPFHGTLAGGSGTSNLGEFTYGHDICLSGASGPLQGTFTLTFGAGTLFGDLMGTAAPNLATLGTADLALSYDVLGGTGLFSGASGTFEGTAFSDPRNGPPSLFSLDFTGDLAAPRLPEPGTWAMLLLGFAATGAAMRRQRRRFFGLQVS